MTAGDPIGPKAPKFAHKGPKVTDPRAPKNDRLKRQSLKFEDPLGPNAPSFKAPKPSKASYFDAPMSPGAVHTQDIDISLKHRLDAPMTPRGVGNLGGIDTVDPFSNDPSAVASAGLPNAPHAPGSIEQLKYKDAPISVNPQLGPLGPVGGIGGGKFDQGAYYIHGKPQKYEDPYQSQWSTAQHLQEQGYGDSAYPSQRYW